MWARMLASVVQITGPALWLCSVSRLLLGCVDKYVGPTVAPPWPYRHGDLGLGYGLGWHPVGTRLAPI
jgi:hypothetical protein